MAEPSILFPVRWSIVVPSFPFPGNLAPRQLIRPRIRPGIQRTWGTRGQERPLFYFRLDWHQWRHHFRFRCTWVEAQGASISVSGQVLAPKFGQAAAHAKMAAGLGLMVEQGYLGIQRSVAGTGALVRSQHATAPKLSSQRCWCKTGSFDGSETTYSHHREDSVNENERSSMTLDAKDLVWLVVQACEVQM